MKVTSKDQVTGKQLAIALGSHPRGVDFAEEAAGLQAYLDSDREMALRGGAYEWIAAQDWPEE